jgi:hypothetical protein
MLACLLSLAPGVRSASAAAAPSSVSRTLAAGDARAASAALTSLSGDVRWATGVLAFSSQFTATNWSAQQALGYPDTYPRYGDLTTSWASATADGQREFIELTYADPAVANYVAVLETLAPGAIDKIETWNPVSSSYDLVWAHPASPAAFVARLWVATFPTTTYPVSRIRLSLNSPAVAGFDEIDAVGIGSGGTSIPAIEYADSASASSEYSATSWSAQNATGAPQIYPIAGDDARAWASATSDGQREWLQLSYAPLDSIVGVTVFETFAPNAVDSVYIRNALDHTLHLVHASPPVALPLLVAYAFQVDFPPTTFPVDGVRLTLASDVVPNFNEIDAVAISRASSFQYLPGITGVPAPGLESGTRIDGARPQPARGATTLDFSLAQAGDARLEVLDLRGARVATLVSGRLAAGAHSVRWDGRDDAGRLAPPGAYFVRLQAGGVTSSRRIVRLD